MPRTCEQNLAIRAQFSKPRHTPMRPPTVAQLLQELLATTTFSEKVWGRIGRKALDSGCPIAIREALTTLQTEANRLKKQRKLLATILPLLYAA
jgi:hypothetical protein